jgi:GDP/UDP-N,N'-diacetylbacillosamine 2-epimerase (hydrolysing)
MRRSRRKVLALTGIRSDYDLLYPLLKALDADPAFELGVVVCGAHLTPLHGYSVRQVAADGFRVAARLPNLVPGDTAESRVRSIGALVSKLAPVLAREKPDLLVVLGDREEPLAGALAAGYMGVPVVHLAGGDNTEPGTWDVDEPVRHAISKLSHVHLTMAEEHSRRLRRMGEQPWRVRTVGSGGIDRLKADPGLSRRELASVLGKDAAGDYLVLIYHALSSQEKGAAAEARLCLQRCLATGLPVFIGAPNSDPGGRAVLRAYAALKHPRARFYRHLERRAFVGLLRHAKALVGNSSLALHEASYLGLPSVNVGERQKGRLAGVNVQFVPATAAALDRALARALRPGPYRRSVRPGRSPYGDGRMAERSLRFLKRLPGRDALLNKRSTV